MKHHRFLYTMSALCLTVVLFGTHVSAQITPPRSTGTVNTVPSECTDGKDNDGDGTIDKTGRTAADGKKYPPDTNCLTAGAICEDGTTTCITTGASQTGGQGTTGSGLTLDISIKNPLKVKTVQEALKLFMDAVLRVAIPFIVIFFIWSGFSFVLARGNTDKLGKAKNMFWYTIIGTLLILGSWTIVNIIIGTINSITS